MTNTRDGEIIIFRCGSHPFGHSCVCFWWLPTPFWVWTILLHKQHPSSFWSSSLLFFLPLWTFLSQQQLCRHLHLCRCRNNSAKQQLLFQKPFESTTKRPFGTKTCRDSTSNRRCVHQPRRDLSIWEFYLLSFCGESSPRCDNNGRRPSVCERLKFVIE